MIGANLLAILVLLTILIAIGVYLLHWLYRHSSKEQSFVRTGFGGERVVMGGGAFVIPIIHNITLVNMNAIPVEIRRAGEASIITKNKVRVDLVTEFLVRVTGTKEGVSKAAATLGRRTMSAEDLRGIVQGRFVDAMATVAATMTMEEIHTHRNEYIQKVKDLAAQTLDTNGLELENASLTSLNQSDITAFNPANAFDAEGLTQLTEQIEERRRHRNAIENDARLQIKLKDFETEQRALQIDRDLEYARIDQSREIETRKATQRAAIEEERSSSAISISNAQVRAEEEAERIRIAKEKAVEAERINSATEIRNLEITLRKDTELTEIGSAKSVESQRILSRRDIEAERIEREQEIKAIEIRSRQDVSVIETAAMAAVDQARLEKERQVEEDRINTRSTIEMLEIEKEKQIRVSNEQAAAEQEMAAIAKRHSVDMERLLKDESIVQREISKSEKIKLAESAAFRAVEDASITANREIEEMRIAARAFVDSFEIERRKEIQIVDKERLIAVINKSIEEAVAKTKAADAETKLASVEERIASARAEEIANRSKTVELIDAAAKHEREAQRITTMANADKEAAELRAGAEIAEAEAAAVRYAKDAEGHKLLNESENMRSDASRRSAIYENLVRNLPAIIRETVKPMENIDSIKILQVDGLPGLNGPSETGGGAGGNGDGSGGGSMSDRVVSSAMKYRTQVAFVDGLMKDIGLPLEGLGSAGGMSFRNFPEVTEGSKAPKDGGDS